MSLQSKLQRTELPRRILGAVLSVLVPGAGHVVLGYKKLGWIIAAASLGLGASVVISALIVAPVAFLVLGALYILGTVASVVTVLALPPGPQLKDGLRGLWPVLVLAIGFRGAAYVRSYVLEGEVIADNVLAPLVVEGDVLLVHPGHGEPQPGDVIRFGVLGPDSARRLRRVLARPDAAHLEVQLDDQHHELITLDQVTGRALFVMATNGKAADGRGRIWKPLNLSR